MSAESRAPFLAGVLAFAGILFVGLSLRTVVTSISPLFEMISVEMPLDALTLGIIAAAPTLVYAFSGVFTPTLARRLGLERMLIIAILAMIIGHAARALAAGTGVLLVATVLTLLGSGVGNVLVPPLIKRYFPHRIGLVTAVYVASLAVSSALPALVAVPLAEFAGWRFALGIYCAGAVLVAIPWLLTLRRAGRRESGAAERGDAAPPTTEGAARIAGIGRSRIAWSLVGLFAMCSFGGFAMLAWMPTILFETADVDPAVAGSLLSLFALCGLPIAVVIPPIVARWPRAIVPIIVMGIASFGIGYLGLMIAPAAAPLLWVLALGIGSLPYPLCFTLIGLRTRATGTALSVSGFVQTVGYVFASIGPFTVGVLHDLTGSWTLPLAFLMSAVLLAVPAAFVLGRPRFVEDELAERSAARRG